MLNLQCMGNIFIYTNFVLCVFFVVVYLVDLSFADGVVCDLSLQKVIEKKNTVRDIAIFCVFGL